MSDEWDRLQWIVEARSGIVSNKLDSIGHELGVWGSFDPWGGHILFVSLLWYHKAIEKEYGVIAL